MRAGRTTGKGNGKARASDWVFRAKGSRVTPSGEERRVEKKRKRHCQPGRPLPNRSLHGGTIGREGDVRLSLCGWAGGRGSSREADPVSRMARGKRARPPPPFPSGFIYEGLGHP